MPPHRPPLNYDPSLKAQALNLKKTHPGEGGVSPCLKTPHENTLLALIVQYQINALGVIQTFNSNECVPLSLCVALI